LIATGYHLKSLLATPAGFVSLPLRPLAGPTATLSGTAAFVTTPGASVLVGSNLFDSPLTQAAHTSTTAPTTIPATPITPGRIAALFAFAGTFEPTSVATYNYYGSELLGSDGATLTAPPEPASGGGTVATQLTLVNSGGSTKNLASLYGIDFSGTPGL